MFKKLVIASAILAVTTSVAFAGAPYLGGSVGIDANTSGSANARGIPFKIFGGYGSLVSQNFYLAGEIVGTVGTATISDHGLKNSYALALDVLPGVMLSDHTMGFARLGVARSRFTPKGFSNSTVTGAQIGLGLQTSLMQSWDLRFEYVYTNYGSINSTVGSPRSDETDLGLIYKFD